MEFGPIWRALLRNKSTYILIALQIAVTMAIMVNSIVIIQERSRLMSRTSGIDEANIFHLANMGFAVDYDAKTTIEEDLRLIRGMPGVQNAIQSNSVPLRNGGWSMGLSVEPGSDQDGVGTAIYFVDEHGLDTFGVDLIAGKNFAATDVAWDDPDSSTWPDTGIITRALATTLFPDNAAEDAVGKIVYINDNEPVTVIGVIEQMQAPWNGWSGVERSTLTPRKRVSEFNRYVIRAEPGYRDELMPQIEQLLAEQNKGRIIQSMRTMEETREQSYQGDEAMVKLLLFIVVLLTAITGLGIVGLASFSVSRRTKQIGVRRALGATRAAILRYFLVENFLISSVGIVFGAILAIAINIWMVQTFDLTPIRWFVIPIAMCVLLVVGQFAVYGPARRATLVSPATATRSA